MANYRVNGDRAIVDGYKTTLMGKDGIGAHVQLVDPLGRTIGNAIIDGQNYFQFDLSRSTIFSGVYTIRFYGSSFISGFPPDGDWELLEVIDVLSSQTQEQEVKGLLQIVGLPAPNKRIELDGIVAEVRFYDGVSEAPILRIGNSVLGSIPGISLLGGGIHIEGTTDLFSIYSTSTPSYTGPIARIRVDNPGGAISGLRTSLNADSGATPISVVDIASVDNFGLHHKAIVSIATGQGGSTFSYGGDFAVVGSGLINYGIRAGAQGATTNWAAYFTDGDVNITNTLWFSSSSDTNLYRSAANILKTDDSLTVVGTLRTETLVRIVVDSVDAKVIFDETVTGEQITIGRAVGDGKFVVGSGLDFTSRLLEIDVTNGNTLVAGTVDCSGYRVGANVGQTVTPVVDTSGGTHTFTFTGGILTAYSLA